MLSFDTVKQAKIVFSSFFKAFVKKDDIDREGFDTDEDYGDYLLRTKQISAYLYNKKINQSKEMISTYEK